MTEREKAEQMVALAARSCRREQSPKAARSDEVFEVLVWLQVQVLELRLELQRLRVGACNVERSE